MRFFVTKGFTPMKNRLYMGILMFINTATVTSVKAESLPERLITIINQTELPLVMIAATPCMDQSYRMRYDLYDIEAHTDLQTISVNEWLKDAYENNNQQSLIPCFLSYNGNHYTWGTMHSLLANFAPGERGYSITTPTLKGKPQEELATYSLYPEAVAFQIRSNTDPTIVPTPFIYLSSISALTSERPVYIISAIQNSNPLEAQQVSPVQQHSQLFVRAQPPRRSSWDIIGITKLWYNIEGQPWWDFLDWYKTTQTKPVQVSEKYRVFRPVANPLQGGQP
jgi:hypothetical protein